MIQSAVSNRTLFSWTDSGAETPPDSSLSEDSSYVSAKDSLTSVNSLLNRSVRFSPITKVGSDRISLAPEYFDGRHTESLLDLPVHADGTAPLEAFRVSNNASARNEYSSPLRKADYAKREFLRNF